MDKENPNFAAIEARHADKGSWAINEQELAALLPQGPEGANEAKIILAIAKETSQELGKDPQIIDLKPEGLIRARNMGKKVFDVLPEGRSVLLVIDSGKPRAKLTCNEATGKLHELETRQKDKLVDMVQIEDLEFIKMLQDEDTGTWPAYGSRMEQENLTESQALAMQVNEQAGNQAGLPGKESPQEAENRYRDIITTLKQRVTSENVPVIVFGVGHSGPLALIRRQEAGSDISAAETPTFCEIYKFDEKGNLLGTEKVNLENGQT